MRRRCTVLALLALGAAPLASFAQLQSAKVARIGFLGPTSAVSSMSRVEALRAGLRDLGYVEGKNIAIEFRWADDKYERLSELAADLVRQRVDVIVTYGAPGTLAAKRASATVPIVMAISGDAVLTGLVASLARPGGNITGTTEFAPELMAKRLELLKEAMPRITQVAALLNPSTPLSRPIFQAMEITAKSLKLELLQFGARAPNEFESVFSEMAKRRVDTVVVQEDPMLVANVKTIADIASKQRLPSIGGREFAEAGGLIGYGVNILEMFRRAAYFVDKILKGVKPSDLPVEQSTKFELVINLKTAKALGVTIPRPVLLRADRVIE